MRHVHGSVSMFPPRTPPHNRRISLGENGRLDWIVFTLYTLDDVVTRPRRQNSFECYTENCSAWTHAGCVRLFYPILDELSCVRRSPAWLTRRRHRRRFP